MFRHAGVLGPYLQHEVYPCKGGKRPEHGIAGRGVPTLGQPAHGGFRQGLVYRRGSLLHDHRHPPLSAVKYEVPPFHPGHIPESQPAEASEKVGAFHVLTGAVGGYEALDFVHRKEFALAFGNLYPLLGRKLHEGIFPDDPGPYSRVERAAQISGIVGRAFGGEGLAPSGLVVILQEPHEPGAESPVHFAHGHLVIVFAEQPHRAFQQP